MADKNNAPQSTCATCGTAFHCGYRAGDQTCWCFQLPRITIDETVSGCFCPNCLQDRLRQQNKRQDKGQISDEENRITPAQ